MKYSKRYICLTIILLLVVALKFNRNGSEQVETFRGAQMEPKVWNPLIAESVNENPLSLVVDNRIYSNEDYDIYMNRKLDIMIPVSLVRDSFNCSAGLYDKEKLVVEKHEESADFSLEDKQLTKKNDNYYVSASKLSKSLSYDYSWDIEKNTASAADVSGATSIYPSKYDLREKGRATTVRESGQSWYLLGISVCQCVRDRSFAGGIRAVFCRPYDVKKQLCTGTERRRRVYDGNGIPDCMAGTGV